MKKQILSIGKTLDKVDQKKINGGTPKLLKTCNGTGTGGVNYEGYSSACIGVSGDCMINGYLAACTGNNGGFWFY